MPDTGQPVIEVRNLHKAFGDNKVLRGMNLNVNSGENVAILGRSGSGKSVLIKCMVGLLKPDSGVLRVLGESIPEMDRWELDAIRQRIGFLFQGNALYDSMTVRENLEFPFRRRRSRKPTSAAEMDARVRKALASVGLEDAIDLLPAELSGGMQKRVALARTLIMEPDVILYDEPTGGLDPVTARGISRLIVDVQQQHKASALIITHDIMCAKIAANRVLVLRDGVNYIDGTYAELEAATDPFVRSFFE